MTTDNNHYYIRLTGFWTTIAVPVLLAALSGSFLLGRAYFSDAIQAKEETIRRLEGDIKSYAESAKLNLPKSIETLAKLSMNLEIISDKMNISLGAEEVINNLNSENVKLTELNKKNNEQIQTLNNHLSYYMIDTKRVNVSTRSSVNIFGKDVISVESTYTIENPSASVIANINGKQHKYSNMMLNDRIEFENTSQTCTIVLEKISTYDVQFALYCEKK